MQIRLAAFVCVVSGCGLVSGLDNLGVTDAASDATSDEQSDALPLLDAPPIADANFADSGVSIHCGPALTCTGNTHCCANSGNITPFTCAATACPNGALTLDCVDQSDCPTQFVCCLSGSVASCQTATKTCATTLCAPDDSVICAGKCMPFDAGAGLNLDKCF